jgi:hypothetical protein
VVHRAFGVRGEPRVAGLADNLGKDGRTRPNFESGRLPSAINCMPPVRAESRVDGIGQL